MNDDDNKKLNNDEEKVEETQTYSSAGDTAESSVDVTPVGEKAVDASASETEEIKEELEAEPVEEQADADVEEVSPADEKAEDAVQEKVNEENEKTAEDLGVESGDENLEIKNDSKTETESEDSEQSLNENDDQDEKEVAEEEKKDADSSKDSVEDNATEDEAETADDQAANVSTEEADDVVADENINADGTPTTANDNPLARWYVVHTYSGHENRVATNLRQRIETEGLEHKIIDILVPTQDKIEIRGGKKEQVKEKVFPGYILVKMELDNDTWLAVRTTQGVISFVGAGSKPLPISDAEVKSIVQFMNQGAAPTFKEVFLVDDTVKIIDGPFADFIGKVDSVDKEKGKLRVLVSIFGRETPVELDFLQVSKL